MRITNDTKNAAMNGLEPYLRKFEKFERETKHPTWVFPLRKAGMARFAELGFPTLHDEDWRFTNVAPISKLPFIPSREVPQNGLSSADVRQLTFGNLAATRLVFVNGYLVPGLSTQEERSIRVTSLASALASDSQFLEKHLAQYAGNEGNAFTALNTAFFEDGAFIYVPAGVHVERPIHLLFLSTAREAGVSSNPRNLVIAEKGSSLTLIESYASLADVAYFTNAVTEMIIGDGAVVEHCKFQDESPSAFHMAGLHARLDRRSNFTSHSIAVGAKLSRNNIRASLSGEGLECILNGLYLTQSEQLADHHMVVEHAQPHCNSHEYFNGILDDQSKGVFHGRILVREAAQKTDAKQTNKNLLLSENATVDTKPQLEIYADDVKCTHGATVGQLNEESIFYLRARGIGADTARRMLIHAFAGEIIERVRCLPVREELDKIVWERLERNTAAKDGK
jgi:Fe-S cluster assembly protein SufD